MCTSMRTCTCPPVSKGGAGSAEQRNMAKPAPFFVLLVVATVTAGDISKLEPAARTTVANSLWQNDAFPRSPEVPAGGSTTIAFFNATGGGRVTHIHLVLAGPPRAELQRHVALAITYDGLAYPSVFVPVVSVEDAEGGGCGVNRWACSWCCRRRRRAPPASRPSRCPKLT